MRLVLTVPPSELPRVVYDQAARLLEMALAEAGYPTTCVWDGRRYVLRPSVPDAVLDKARLLVFARLGIPYEIVA